MKKFTPNGAVIKKLREQLGRFSTQKEFCHEVGISERLLRKIENTNAPIAINIVDRMAKVLSVHRNELVYSIDLPRVVPASDNLVAVVTSIFDADRMVERYDYDYARATMDEAALLKEANSNHDVVCLIETQLTGETTEYVEELIEIVTGLSWSERSILNRPGAKEEIALRRRIRQLLVLLKGNDVWVYVTSHLRRLPERHTIAPSEEPHNLEGRLVVAFGPPGEYGETSLKVAIDHGQPFILRAWNKASEKAG